MDQVFIELADWMTCTFSNLATSSSHPPTPTPPVEDPPSGFFSSWFSRRQTRPSGLSKASSAVGLASPRRKDLASLFVLPPGPAQPADDASNEEDLVIFTPKRLRSPSRPISILKKPKGVLTIEGAALEGASAVFPRRSSEDYPPTAPRSLPSMLASALSRPSSATGMSRSQSSTPSFITAPRSTPTASSSSPATPPGGPSSRAPGSKLNDRVLLDEQELLRRRREDAVFGMGDIHARSPMEMLDSKWGREGRDRTMTTETEFEADDGEGEGEKGDEEIEALL